MDVTSEVHRILSEELCREPGEIRPEANLVDDLGADSLDMVEVPMVLEEEFGIRIGDEEVDPVNTVAELTALVQAKVDAKNGR